MQTIDFFRNQIYAMINLNDSLPVLVTRLPWGQIEAAVAAKFEHQNRVGQVLQRVDMLRATQTVMVGGRITLGAPSELHEAGRRFPCSFLNLQVLKFTLAVKYVFCGQSQPVAALLSTSLSYPCR